MAKAKKPIPKEAPMEGRMITSSTAVVAAGDTTISAWSPPTLEDLEPAEALPMRLAMPAASRPGEHISSSAPISTDEPFEKIAARRPEDVARVIQALLSTIDSEDDEGLRKVATLVIGLGPQLAASVMQHCTPDETERIARAAWKTKAVTAREAREIFEEAREKLLAGDYNLEGGWGFMTQLLYKTHGTSGEARNTIDRLLESEPEGKGIQLLSGMVPDQAAPYLQKEHPQTVALTLSLMDPQWVAEVLNQFAEDLRSEVLDRIRDLDAVPAAVLSELKSALEYDTRALISGRVQQVGGSEAVDGIVKQLGSLSPADARTTPEDSS